MEGEITPLASSASMFATPSSSCSFDDLPTIGGDDGGSRQESPFAPLRELAGDWFDAEEHRVLLELQQMVNRYNDCFCRLQSALSDLESLRRENLRLAAENLELAFLIDDLESPSSSSEEKPDPPAHGGSDGTRSGGGAPKSIAIRSSAFLAAKHPCAHRLRLPPSPASAADGDGEIDEGLEVEAYGQGSLKTELCNKWGEGGGRCPYGARCRFAHGVEELRPVLRHPRYKTQPCRMLAAPGGCPYGHRCHFRHAALPP